MDRNAQLSFLDKETRILIRNFDQESYKTLLIRFVTKQVLHIQKIISKGNFKIQYL